MVASKWAPFAQRCLLERIPGHEFQELAALLHKDCQITGKKLIQIILECRQSFSISSDPLIPQYFRAAIVASLSQISDVLFVLIRNWNSRRKDQGLALELRKPGCLSSPDALIINDLALILASTKAPASASEINKILSLTSQWLVALIGWISEDGANRSYLAVLTLLEALGILLASGVSTENGMLLLGNGDDSALRFQVTEALETTLPFLNSISTQLHTRLDMIQKHFNLFRASGTAKDAEQLVQNPRPMPDALQFAGNIVQGPSVRARASLYIYMNAAFCGPPMVPDASLMDYLNVRYVGDHISIFIDVIVAMFDVLSNAQSRNEGEDAINVYRSFLMNRLPSLLVLISSSSLQPVPASLCISQALSRIDLSAFPLSAYDIEHRSPLAGIRQEFLFACALYRLIPEDSVERLLGENPMQTLPSHGLRHKDELIQQMTSSPQRIEQLIAEIELMEGNAGVVATAIIELMHSHCRHKDTVQLKDICNLVVRKPQVLDIMTIFKSPAHILGPLCLLLDEWNWTELQGESQPVYEEFGAILLLILCAAHRYQLEPFEVGTTDASSFVRDLLEMDTSDDSLDTFKELKEHRLGDWIAALFVADSLSDELTSSCSPHEFYRLVPTIVEQSLEACITGKLGIEALKSGFDYLLEPFLLPSVLLGLQWLVKDLWRATAGTSIKFSILLSLIKGPSSKEARGLHQTILSMVADPLDMQLQTVGSEDPEKPTASAITSSLLPYLSPKRRGDWVSEVFQSSTVQSIGLLNSIAQNIQQLLNWSTAIEVNNPPPRYSFKFVSVALQLHGALIVMNTFLRELKMLLGTDKFDAGVDIVASIICAPLSTGRASSYRLSLHDALDLARAESAKALKTQDASWTEALVRLHQKVEALSAGVSQRGVAMDPMTSMGPELSTIDLQNINLDAAAGNPEMNATDIRVQTSSEDIGQILEGAANVGNYSTNSMGAAADDIYGLDSGDMQMMNFDEMDLEGMFEGS